MTNSNRLQTLLLASLFLGLGCTSSDYGSGGSRNAGNENKQVFHLYRVDIDHEAVRRGAPLLFQEPPPGAEMGAYRRCQGIFGVSGNGFVRCEVKVAELVVGAGGRNQEQGYTLLEFFGKVSKDGNFATIEGGETSGRGGVELTFTERGDDRLTIQPRINDQLSAYRYHFQRQGFANARVPFPWK
ncbi:MAG: hypothetical protein KDB53_05355 [Planctomycetes bacterium]|nr:hypothetical protein [Planctomycetota bacterium]